MHPIQILVEFLPESWQSLFWLETEESTAGSSLKLQKMVRIMWFSKNRGKNFISSACIKETYSDNL